MKKATLLLMSLILLVAFTGICEARHMLNVNTQVWNPNLILYIPPTLNQPYGFPVKMWDGYMMVVPEEYTGWHTTCIGASWIDKTPKPAPTPEVVVKEKVVVKYYPVTTSPKIVTKIRIIFPHAYFGVNNKAVTCDKGTIPTLDQIVKLLQDNPAIKVEIRGYTDDTGKDDLNQKLSEKRALAVQKYLIDKGISQDRLTVIGCGASNPISDNKTAVGRSQNRRVEFIVIE